MNPTYEGGERCSVMQLDPRDYASRVEVQQRLLIVVSQPDRTIVTEPNVVFYWILIFGHFQEGKTQISYFERFESKFLFRPCPQGCRVPVVEVEPPLRLERIDV